MGHRCCCRRVPACGNLPHLDKVAAAVRNSKVLLAEGSGRDRVGRAATTGGRQEEELLDDRACFGIQTEGRDVAGGAGLARTSGGQ